MWRTLKRIEWLLLAGLFSAACSNGVAATSACRNLAYDDGGVPRAQYLPCAGETIAALDELVPQAEAASRNDSGGAVERVGDISINNAATHYEAFYMVRILDEPHQFAAQTREAARVELRSAVRRSEEASTLYRRLR